MRRSAQSWTSLSGVKVHLSVPRFYSTENGIVHANSQKVPDVARSMPSAADEPDLDALFNFGDALSGIDPQSKTLKTAVGSLPISPLLDPTWRKARERRKKKEPPQFKDMGRFQKRMKQNPYAQLLAEPVRSCHATRARVPKPFLLNFGLVTHPGTGKLWWMPAGFEEPTKSTATKPLQESEARIVKDNDFVTSGEPVLATTALPDEVADAAAARDTITTAAPQANLAAKQKGAFWAPAHVLARQDLLMEFWENKSKYSGSQYKLATLTSMSKWAPGAKWRSDMHEVLRERMRRVVVDNLIDMSKTCESGDRDYVVKIDTPQDSLRYQNKNCFLLITGEYKPFDYLEVPGVPGSARPVYHLPEMLGAEQWQRLKSESPLFGDDSPLREGSFVLLKGKANIGLNKQLWRLQGFVADYAGAI